MQNNQVYNNEVQEGMTVMVLSNVRTMQLLYLPVKQEKAKDLAVVVQWLPSMYQDQGEREGEEIQRTL